MPETSANKNKRLLTGIVVYAALILVLLLITNIAPFNRFLSSVLRLLRPVLIGFCLAYLLNPFFRFFEQKFFAKLKHFGVRRGLSLLFTYLVLVAIFAILILLIVPQLVDSIMNFIDNSEAYLEKILNSVNGVIASLNGLMPPKADGAPAIPPLTPGLIKESISKLFGALQFDTAKLLEFVTAENVGTLIDAAKNVLNLFGDILFGLFISLYLLASKEKRYAQVMRWRRAYYSDAVNSYITKVCTTADRSFGGFLKGKLLDSCIVGVLVFLSISALGIPYAILIAVIVAITDIIPIIGPFIGVIPSAIIILLTDPSKVIPFILCILVIQQIDGNIIAPKILGENTGVSSLCVMISITTLGTLWGLPGMILGVPLFATVLELANDVLSARLKKKGLSTATEDYYAADLAGEEIPVPAAEQDGTEVEPTVALQTDGAGALTANELSMLRAYSLAHRHSILSSPTEEERAAFTAELTGNGSSLDESTPTQETDANERCDGQEPDSAAETEATESDAAQQAAPEQSDQTADEARQIN